MAAALSELQRESLRYAHRALVDELLERGSEWVRSRSAGERVTLASLERRGYLERRPWRGDGESRDSAFEYRLGPSLRAECIRRLRRSS